MADIAYFVHGRGSGHASRTCDIVARLRRDGHCVHISAGGDALRLLREEHELRHVQPVLPGVRGLAHALRRTLHDSRYLTSRRFDLSVTDGDAPGLHASSYAGIPTIAIGHGLVFNRVKTDKTPWHSRMYERFNSGSSSWMATRKVAVHFLASSPLDDNTLVARPTLSDLVGVVMHRPAPYFVSYFRDRNGDDIIRQVADLGYEVHHFGETLRPHPNVICHPFARESFLRALRGSRAAIASAGSNLLSEAIALHKPVLACYKSGDHEQAMNASLAMQQNLAVAAELGGDLRSLVATFVARALAGDFARHPLCTALRPVDEVVSQLCLQLLGRAPLESRRCEQEGRDETARLVS